MLRGSGRGLGDDGGDGSGTTLWEEDAVNSGTVGCAKEGAEVVGVFNAVEGEVEAATTIGSGGE
jgi:hypothetical protein